LCVVGIEMRVIAGEVFLADLAATDSPKP
jgi:hypothetical protein